MRFATYECIILFAIPEAILSVFSDVDLALTGNGGQVRVAALRRLSTIPTQRPTSSVFGAAISPGPSLVRQHKNWTELDLAQALRSGRDVEIGNILAFLIDMPIEAVTHALDSEDSRYLLLLGRALNFSWSTNVSLLQLRQKRFGRENLDALQIEELGQWYDLQRRDRAERAVRFMRVRLWARPTAQKT